MMMIYGRANRVAPSVGGYLMTDRKRACLFAVAYAIVRQSTAAPVRSTNRNRFIAQYTMSMFRALATDII